MNKSISAYLAAYRTHILAWTVFIAYEMWLVYALQGVFSSVANYASHYLIIILWFYFAGNLIFPWTFKDLISALWKFPIAIVVLFAVFTLANYGLDVLLIKFDLLGKKTGVALNKNYLYRTSFRFIYLLGIATAYYFVKNYIKQKNISLELEKQKLGLIIEEERTKRALSKAHNDFLKAQINPHFLFNTLDYVYHTVSTQSPQAADAVLNLSDMMRYAVKSSEQEEHVKLALEMEQVEKLIHLYQLRKNEQLNIIMDFDPEAAELQFLPLILMTLVENIFKHGNVSDQNVGIQIYVLIEKQNLVIETLNALNINPKTDSTRAGLKNITDRLGFAYGEEAQCLFSADVEVFRTKITVPLNAINKAATADTATL